MMVILLTPVTLVTLITLITLITLVTLVTLVTMVTLFIMVTLVSQFYRAECITVSGYFAHNHIHITLRQWTKEENGTGNE